MTDSEIINLIKMEWLSKPFLKKYMKIGRKYLAKRQGGNK